MHGASSFDARLGAARRCRDLVARQPQADALSARRPSCGSPQACLEDLDYAPRRELDRSARSAHSPPASWIAEHQQRPHHRARPASARPTSRAPSASKPVVRATASLYRRVPRLFRGARAGACRRLLRDAARPASRGSTVLILDDWGLGTARPTSSATIFSKSSRTATACAPPSSRASCPATTGTTYLGDPTIADAVLDRLVHNAYKITLKGPSRRKEKAKNA